MSEYENKFWSTWVNNYWEIVTVSAPGGWYTHVRESNGREDIYFPVLEAKTEEQARKNHAKALQYVLDGYKSSRERPIVRWEETGHAWENS